jgi:hypothetical protein
MHTASLCHPQETSASAGIEINSAACRFTLHKMDVLDADSWLYIQSKYMQPAFAFSLNNQDQPPLLALPEPTNSSSGALYYSKTPALNRMYSWNGTKYNDTTATMLLAGALFLQQCCCLDARLV